MPGPVGPAGAGPTRRPRSPESHCVSIGIGGPGPAGGLGALDLKLPRGGPGPTGPRELSLCIIIIPDFKTRMIPTT